MKNIRLENELREIIKSKIKYEFNEQIDDKLDEIMMKLRDIHNSSEGIREDDTITIEFPFVFTGFSFLSEVE